ncbi:MAG: tyrosine-type recombinase/integrase [Desulforegulaceae bacterium]|nr:tyrosine-type recombinase/integrase [Desulforegulaceae bacterium]
MENQEWNQLVLKFLSFLETEKNSSAHTITGYHRDLKDFYFYIKNNFSQLNPEDIEKDQVRNYLYFLHSKKYKPSSIRRKIASLASFYNYLLKIDLVKKNPCTGISLPKLPQTIPSFIGIDDMFYFLDSISVKTWLDARNKAVFELMYSTGIRVSELVGLNVDDIFDSGFIKVFGKGRKERIIPCSSKALKFVKDYIELVEMEINKKLEGALFLNRFKTRIRARSIARILDALILKAGLHFKTSPHKIRHSFATHMLDNGADLRFIQEFLNHKSLSTTQKYTHVTMDRLMEVYDKSHPRN